jgi:hypothetical protein
MKVIQRELGTHLCRIVAGGQQEVVLAAPFIKLNVVQRLFSAAPSTVPGKIFTRWRPEEVAAGVSDLEVFDAVSARPGWNLFLCEDLHAKYYRVDDICLIGSANLTQTALEWKVPSNIELLVESSTDIPFWFEEKLHSSSVIATRDIQQAILEAASVISARQPKPVVSLPIQYPEVDGMSGFVTWIPLTRNPTDLLSAINYGFDQLTQVSAENVTRDLERLQIDYVKGEELSAIIRARLIQHPLVIKVSEFCYIPRRFGAVSDLMSDWIAENGLSRNPDEAWQTLMRWLLFFFPQKYRLEQPRHSEVFSTIV